MPWRYILQEITVFAVKAVVVGATVLFVLEIIHVRFD